jgi:hypothetical protein
MHGKAIATTALVALIASGAFAQTVGETAANPAVTDGERVVAGEREGYPLDQGWQRVDMAGLSADDLVGEDIVDMDGETIASIDEVLLDQAGETMLVAQFGGFLGFGSDRVLMSMSDVDVVRDANDRLIVRTNITPEALEARPAYEEG